MGDHMLSRGHFNAHLDNCDIQMERGQSTMSNLLDNRVCCHLKIRSMDMSGKYNNKTGLCHLLDANSPEQIKKFRAAGIKADKSTYIYNSPSVLKPQKGVGSPKERTRVYRQMHGKGVVSDCGVQYHICPYYLRVVDLGTIEDGMTLLSLCFRFFHPPNISGLSPSKA